jgi:hypothetical protein
MQFLIKREYLRLPLSFSFFGLILVIDQLLLPMFHFNGLPFKFSYFLVALWFLNFLVKRNKNYYENREFLFFSFAILLIMLCGILGELFFLGYFNADGFEPLIRSMLIYTLTIFSFGLGLSSKKFNINWLIPIFLVAISLNFIFIFFKTQVPSWLISIYYSQAYVNDFAALGITDVKSILELGRPRGLFPNPNGSAFMVNIISLFIYLGIKKNLCKTPSSFIYFLIIILPIILSMLLASRGEFLVSLLLGFLHARLVFLYNKKFFFRIGSFVILGITFIGTYASQKIDMEEFRYNFERVLSIVEILNNANDSDDDVRELSSIARPLQVFVPAYERFKISPVFGSGFARVTGVEYLSEGTDYFHNDWFRLLVTSGFIGFFCMLWILNRFILPLGWVALIPFVLPGMVNTFLLNINAVMFFFFMIAVIRSKLNDN